MGILEINNGDFILEYYTIYSGLYICNGDGIEGLVIKEVNDKFFRIDEIHIESGWTQWSYKCSVASFKILYSVDGINYRLYKQFDKQVGDSTWKDDFKVEIDDNLGYIKSLKLVAIANNYSASKQKQMNVSNVSLINPIIKNKIYIIEKDGFYKTFKNNQFQNTNSQILSKSLFENEGFNCLTLINNIDKIDMNLLVYDDTPNELRLKCKLKESFRPIDKFKGEIKIIKQEKK